MTDDEILLHGGRARTLLENPIFVEALSGFANMHLSALLATNDEDVDSREKHFRQLRAYENIANDLKARVEAADEILRAREAQPQDDEDYQE